MSKYSFTRYVGIPAACFDYISKLFPNANGYSYSEGVLEVSFPTSLNSLELQELTQKISEYQDPDYWLDLYNTETYPFQSIVCDSQELIDMQAIIVTPYNQNGVVLGSMKTIVKYNCKNHAAFVSNPTEPIKFNLVMNDYSSGNSNICNVETDITNEVQNIWVPMVQAGSNVLPSIYKTTQIYGLKDLCPGADCIWTFQSSISNSNVTATINSLQKLFYYVTYPGQQ